MRQVAPFFVLKKSGGSLFIVTWPPNLISSDTFTGISGPDSDEKLAPNIIDKYIIYLMCKFSCLWATNNILNKP